MSRFLRILLGAVAVGASAASAAFPPYTELEGKYKSFSNWDTRLPTIWTGWKSRFVIDGLIQGNDPDGNKRPISEGQAYGMCLAVWMGDQTAFNSIWQATETSFWKSSKNWYSWITSGDDNFAGDADIDICGALIFASALVDEGIWTNSTVGGNTYKAKAKIVLQSIITNFIDQSNNYRINSWPGAGDGIRNPSYHMPFWYPIFKEFGAANSVSGMDWDKAANGAFDLLEAQPNSSKGMARNFSNGSGGSPSGNPTSTPNNYDMGFDAIRVPYRIGLAGIWYPSKFPRAISYAKKVWANGAVDPDQPGMYQVANATLWGWTEHEYEEFMTRAMWGTLAASVQDSSDEGAAAFSTIKTYMSGNHVKPGLGYLSGANTDSTCESCPARNYFAQSLGLLGALAIAGRAWNIWDDLKNPWTPPDTTPKITTALTATPASIEQTASGTTAGTANTTLITATWNRSVSWKVRFVGRTSGGTYEKTGTSSSVSFSWYSTLKAVLGKAFTTEVVDVHMSASGFDSTKVTTFKTTVTITQSSSIQPRKATVASFAKGGVVLSDHLWNAGEQVRTRVLDLAGRELQSGAVSTLEAADNGVVVSLALQRSLNVRLLEVSDLNGTRASRYLISPNP
jgi:endo-1,4-beta-D-glucanase Y